MSKSLLIINENIYQISGKRIKNLNKGIFYKCTDEEKKAVMSKLEKNKGKIFKSEKLNEIAEKNNFLKQFDIFEEILDDVEKVIPSEYRENFYENLTLLKGKINTIYMSNICVPAYYNSFENIIYLNIPIIINEKKKVEDYISQGLFETPFHDYLKEVIIHESFHVSSTKYHLNEHTMYSGFRKISRECNKYESINEAVTEILSRKILNSQEINNQSGYNIQTCVMRELSGLIGEDVIIKSYFENDQMNYIKNELAKIINDENKINQLIDDLFANNDPLTDEYKGNDEITQMQNIILDFYEKRISDLLNSDKKDEVKKLIRSLNENYSCILNDEKYNSDLDFNSYKIDNIKRFYDLCMTMAKNNGKYNIQSQRRRSNEKRRTN